MRRLIGKILPVLVFIMTAPVLSFADPDPGPCNDNDPFDNTCPLDTWVYLLAFVALAAGIWYINKNKKSLFA